MYTRTSFPQTLTTQNDDSSKPSPYSGFRDTKSSWVWFGLVSVIQMATSDLFIQLLWHSMGPIQNCLSPRLLPSELIQSWQTVEFKTTELGASALTR